MADGAEEMEAVIVVDVLRRGKIDVTLAGLHDDISGPIICSRNLKIVADSSLKDAMDKRTYDAVILPGGLKGAENLAVSNNVKKLLMEQEQRGGVIAAICAAPTALQAHGIGKGKRVTSYPAFKGQLEGYYTYSEDYVVVDGQLVTSRGPGTAFEFALKLVEILVDVDTAENVCKGLLLK